MSGGTWRMEISAPGCSFLNNGFTPEQFICPCWEDESGCPVVVQLMSAVMSLEDQLSSAFSPSQLVTQGVCWVREPRPGYHQCRNSTERKETPVNYLIYLKWEGKETWDEVGDLICFLLCDFNQNQLVLLVEFRATSNGENPMERCCQPTACFWFWSGCL